MAEGTDKPAPRQEKEACKRRRRSGSHELTRRSKAWTLKELGAKPVWYWLQLPVVPLGCCTKALEHAGAFSCSSRFTCKSTEKESGPEGTRTPGLRHARAALSRLSYGPLEPQQS
jgi:hypothetical protein